MINLSIYLKDEAEAEELCTSLLEQKLVAHASIDYNNHSMLIIDGKASKEINCLITAQTRALLFHEILEFIESQYKNNIKIYSAPITQCNFEFSEMIRLNTKISK